jgi:tRNA pseudouridine38-40 synthase
MPTFRVTLEYEGTRYHGWQEQKNARSVSGELKRAIQELAPFVELGGAGRTDAGVHALAQCAHLRLREHVEPERFRRELNDKLPSDIHVLSVVPAREDYHARHSAVARSYLYQVSRRRTAFAKRYVWWIKRPLALERIEEAAALFTGRHDSCSSAASRGRAGACRGERVGWRSGRLGPLPSLCFLLWKMVRHSSGP